MAGRIPRSTVLAVCSLLLVTGVPANRATAQDEHPFVTIPEIPATNTLPVLITTSPNGRYAVMVCQVGTMQTAAVVLDRESGEFASESVGIMSLVRVTDTQLTVRGSKEHLFTLPNLERPIPPQRAGSSSFRRIARVYSIRGSGSGIGLAVAGNEVRLPKLVAGLRERTSGAYVSNYPREVLGSALADGWVFKGVYYDTDDLNAPRLFLRPLGFMGSEPLDLEGLFKGAGYQPTYSSNVLSKPGQWAIQDPPPVDVPSLGRVVQFNYQPAEGQQALVATVHERDPVNGTAGEALRTINCGVFDEPAPVFTAPAGNHLLATAQNRLYQIALRDENDKVDPVRFALKQSHFVANSTGITEFQHEVLGGAPPYEFSVGGPRGGGGLKMDINGDGVVTFDGEQAIDWAIETLSERWANEPAEILADYHAQSSEQFQTLTGRAPNGVPVLIGMTVETTDTEGDRAVLPYEFFIEVPQDRWLKKLKTPREVVSDADNALAIRAEEDVRLRQQHYEEKERAEVMQYTIAGGAVVFIVAMVGYVAWVLRRGPGRLAVTDDSTGSAGSTAETRSSEAVSSDAPVMEEVEDLDDVPFGGGLLATLFVLIGVILLQVWALAFVMGPIYSDGTWEQLTTPGNDAYHALMGPVLVMETMALIVLLVAELILVFLFLSRSWFFPKACIAVLCGYFIWVVVDFVAGIIVAPPEAGMTTAIRGIASAAVACSIYIPYLSRSPHVKAVFVK